MRKLAPTTAVVIAVLAASAAPASAAEISVSQIWCADTYKAMWVPAGSPGDANRNGAVCIKGKRAIDEIYVFTVKVTVESGGCPVGSLAVAAISNPDYDVNQNSIVCYDPSGKGTWRDDLSVVTDLTLQ